MLGHSYANADHFHFIRLCSDSHTGCDFESSESNEGNTS
jgi:hypothetical protein